MVECIDSGKADELLEGKTYLITEVNYDMFSNDVVVCVAGNESSQHWYMGGRFKLVKHNEITELLYEK